MTWALAAVAVWSLLGVAFGRKHLLRRAPSRPKVDGDPDARADEATLAAAAGWVRTTAIVAGLRQDGMSRGMVRHRCRVDLLVDRPGAAGSDPADPPAPMSADLDLGIEQLAWWLPGSVVDVVVDGADVGGCRPLFAATRARATGRVDLPPTTVRGIPKAVFLKPSERALPPGARRTTALIGSIDVSSPSHGTVCAVTLGLWVDDQYATTVSDRFRLDELVALPRGVTVAVTVDGADRLKVVVDSAAATAGLAARLPGVEAMGRAATELGLPGPVGVLRSVESGRGKHGVRYEYVAVVEPVDVDGAHGAPATVRLMLAVPDAAALVRGSAVVLDATGRTIDLDATNRARVHCRRS